MFGQTFYHSLIRKYVVVFGTIFDDISINRASANTTDATQSLRVPITYAPKEKMLVRLAVDPNLNRPVAMTLPRMSFEMTSYAYDPHRKLPSINKRIRLKPDDPSVHLSQFVPVPYNINFSLFIYCKNADDGARIVEQILPNFTPEYTVHVFLLPGNPLSFDIPIILNGMSSEDSYEGNFDQRRALTWQIDFTVKALFFGPEKTSKMIKFANTTIYDVINANTALPIERMTLQPGLTANGMPTSNVAISVPYLTINESDDYGYISEITEF